MILDEKCPPSTPSCISFALWGFFSPQGNASKLDFDLDSIICLVPNKSVKLSRLAFSFALGYTKLEISQY
jgi:hypothetical protein